MLSAYDEGERPSGWVARLSTVLWLAVIGVTVFTNKPRPGTHGIGLVVTFGLSAMFVAAVAYFVLRWYAPRWAPVGLLAISLSGLGTNMIAPGGAASVFPIAVVWVAMTRERLAYAIGLTVVGLGGTLAVDLHRHARFEELLIMTAVYVGSAGFSYVLRLSRMARLRERESREQVAVEQARTALLDERARIAREIHDILAHTLSAQSVQLEGARMLLRSDAPAEQVLERIERAQRLSRDGMDETRRAVHALRGDPLPSTELIAELAKDADASFDIEGDVRELSPEAGLAVVRAAQEALTNVRKHAPNARTSVTLRFEADTCVLEVVDVDMDGAVGPLAETGGGYGLAGIRERAELVGGSLEAGPTGDGFRVRLTVPA